MAKMTIEQIMTRGRNEGFTPYQIATLANVQLAGMGLEEIRPQMMYNYDRNGLIVRGSKGQSKYSEAEVFEFLNRFVEGRKTKAAAKTPRTVEDLDVEIARLTALRDQMLQDQAETETETETEVDEDAVEVDETVEA